MSTNARSYYEPENLKALGDIFEEARHALAQCGLDRPEIREIVAARIFAMATKGTISPSAMLEKALRNIVQRTPNIAA